MKSFELGELVATRRIVAKCEQDEEFSKFVSNSITRYITHDWGDTCKEDAKMNDDAVQNEDRILAVYKNGKDDQTIWVITEWDRSVTTILFPDEY